MTNLLVSSRTDGAQLVCVRDVHGVLHFGAGTLLVDKLALGWQHVSVQTRICSSGLLAFETADCLPDSVAAVCMPVMYVLFDMTVQCRNP